MSKIEVGGGAGGGGGSGTSSALSGKKFAHAIALVAPPVTVTAGAVLNVDFTGGTVQTAEQYWGAVNGALPLAVTFADGNVILPDLDTVYDLKGSVRLICDAADTGKLVGLTLGANFTDETVWVPVHTEFGVLGARVTVCAFDLAFVGDAPGVTLVVHAEQLTVDATLSLATVSVVER